MRKIFFFNVVFYLLMIGTVHAQQFYYSNGKKVILIEDSSSMVIYESEGIDRNRILDSTQLKKTFNTQDDRLGQYSVFEFEPNYNPVFNKSTIKYSHGFTKPNAEKVWISPFIITKLKQGLNISSIQDILDKYKIDLIYEEFGKLHIKCNNLSDVLDLSNEIYESNKSIWSQPDFLINTTRNENWERQYYLNNTNHSDCGFDNDINALEAWDLTLGCNYITVAVIDDGVEDHPALIDSNGNSRVLPGYTPSGITNNGRPGAGDRHGQACAGIIAASHNSQIRGIAPNVNILPVKVRFGPGIPASEYSRAIDWARENGADIISNSWSGISDDIIINAINDAENLGRDTGSSNLGAIVTFSSGNNGANQISPYAKVSIGVGALNRFDNLAESSIINGRYSNIGPNLDLVAYGGDADNSGNGDIRTIDRIGTNGYSNGDYTNTFSGTSASCPQVSGVAALVLSINPNLTRSEVENILFSTAVDLGVSGKDNNFGYGKVNAFEAVKIAINTLDETFQENSATLALTRIRSNSRVLFTGKPSCNIATGSYFCDVYRAQVDAVSELEYVRYGGDGLSGANPNNGEYWVDIFLNDNIPGNAPPSTSVKTFFYFIKTNSFGQTINQWVPTNPNNPSAKSYYFNPPEDIHINRIVENGESSNVYATNSITLGVNFHAEYGSSFVAKHILLPSDINCLPNPTRSTSTPSNNRSHSNLTDKKILFSSSINIETTNNLFVDEGIITYPNPTNGIINIQSPNTITSYTLRNSTGAKLLDEKINTTNFNIDITKFPTDIYFMQLQTEDNRIITKKVIRR